MNIGDDSGLAKGEPDQPRRGTAVTGLDDELSTGSAVETPEPRARSGGRIARSAAFFSIATSLSRIVGLAREILVAALFGIKGPMSAFTIAFQIPNLVRALFADAAISAAFIPVFTQELEQGSKREAFRLASNLIWLLLALTALLTLLYVLLAPVLVPLFAPGFEGELLSLTVTLSQLMFPILIALGVSGVTAAILNSYGRFAVFALAPVVWNLVIIAVLIALTPRLDGEDRIYAYAAGVIVGTVVQMAFLVWDLRHTPFVMEWKPRLISAARSPDVRRVLLLMVPVMLSIGLINFNGFVLSIFGTLVSDAAPAAIDRAFRLFMLPAGLFVVALSTVIFPYLSRYAARSDFVAIRSLLARGMRQSMVMMLPATAAIVALSVPIVRLVYQRGEFDAAETQLVATALFWFAFGLPYNGLFALQNRTLFSMQRAWVSSAIAAGTLLLTAACAAALYGPFGIAGLVGATVIAGGSMTIVQSVILRHRLGGLEMRRLLLLVVRVLPASVALGLVTWEVWNLIDAALGRGLGGQLASVGGGLLAGGVVYAALLTLFRVPELAEIRAMLARR